jgi:hypothetical protein
MAKAAQKNTNSTQKFIEITDIVDDIVILNSGYACIVIEVKATNFALLSADEQDAKIYSYSALLNSLSFPIQIVIRSKKLNISSYLKLLEEERQQSKNPKFAEQIGMYKDFVAELVKVNTILDKKFYIVIYYSSLEKGVSGVGNQMGVSNSQSLFVIGARASLHSKAEVLHSQIQRIGLKAETLGKEKLIKLFYEIFNDINIDSQQADFLTKPNNIQGGTK